MLTPRRDNSQTVRASNVQRSRLRKFLKAVVNDFRTQLREQQRLIGCSFCSSPRGGATATRAWFTPHPEPRRHFPITRMDRRLNELDFEAIFQAVAAALASRVALKLALSYRGGAVSFGIIGLIEPRKVLGDTSPSVPTMRGVVMKMWPDLPLERGAKSFIGLLGANSSRDGR